MIIFTKIGFNWVWIGLHIAPWGTGSGLAHGCFNNQYLVVAQQSVGFGLGYVLLACLFIAETCFGRCCVKENRMPIFSAVFRIRNDFMRIRIQLFRWMRIRIQLWKWIRIRTLDTVYFKNKTFVKVKKIMLNFNENKVTINIFLTITGTLIFILLVCLIICL
jgi:hypothetical protein